MSKVGARAEALSAAMQAAETTGVADEPEQLALLPLMPAEDLAQAAPVKERRGPGRPKGSVDRRTAEWRDYVLRRYPHPLVALAESWSRPVEVLAKELGCSRLEAFQEQRHAVVAALPYLVRRMPQEVDVSGQGVLPLQIVIGQGQVGQLADPDSLASAVVLEPEQYQQVSNSDPTELEATGVGSDSKSET